MKIKHMKADYIESGAFQGAEQDVRPAGINYGEEVVIMKKSEFRKLKKLAEEAEHTNQQHQHP